MHSSGISIWFFIGVLLTLYGVLILGYGVSEVVTGHYRECAVGCSFTRRSGGAAILLALGLMYDVKFDPAEIRFMQLLKRSMKWQHRSQ